MKSYINSIKRVKSVSLFYILCFFVFNPIANGQNTPNLTQTNAPGGIVVNGGVPVPELENTFYPYEIKFQRSIVPKRRDTTTSNYDFNSNPVYALKSAKYFDGFGNTIQTVIPQYSKLNNTFQSLVTVTDTRNTQSNYTFLPFPLENLTSYDNNCVYWSNDFYRSMYPSEGGTSSVGVAAAKDSNTSTSNERSITSYAPGKTTVGQHRGTTVTFFYNKIAGSVTSDDLNKVQYNIRAWDIDVNGIPRSIKTYQEGVLEGSRTSNSDGSIKWVFRNKDGNVVYEAAFVETKTIIQGTSVVNDQIFAETYYVYDDFGRLRFVIPPKATTFAKSNIWAITKEVVAELCFENKYDAKGRQFAVHKPGEKMGNGDIAYTELVYDKTGRVVLRRSPLESTLGVWEVVVYDDMNRIIQTGTLTNSSSRATWQQDLLSAPSVSTTSIGYYLWGSGKNSRPSVAISGYNVQSQNYFDSYELLTTNHTPLYSDVFSTSAIAPYLVSAFNAESQFEKPSVFGMLVASAVRTVKPSGVASNGIMDWEYSKFFYDKEGRNIYTIYRNATGGKDTIARQFDYLGNVLVSLKYTNVNLGTPKNIRERYKYIYEDFSGRILKIQHRVNNDNMWRDLETNTYDILGRLQMKVYGNNAESQVYSYNLRNELTGINEQYALTGNQEGRHIRFGEALRYDYGFTQPRFDGLVSGVVWRGGTRTQSSAYAYEYDKAGRMLKGNFYSGNNTSNAVPTVWSNAANNYTEFAQYDLEGNITAMQRWGKANTQIIPNNPVAMDRLAYNYQANSNKLVSVVDTNTIAYGRGEYVNGSSQGYSYDVSGNLTKDQSKNISNVTYTWFNKPDKITYTSGNTIEYIYNAGGEKLREYIKDGSTVKQLDYIGNLVYENLSVQYISTLVGRTNLKNNTNKEEFLIKDRLGNVRAVVADVASDIGIAMMANTTTYSAGYELEDASTEELLFEKVAEVRDGKPLSNVSDVKAAVLDGSSNPTGTSIMLKVMAGDKIAINADNFFNQLATSDDYPTIGGNLIEQIVSNLGGGSGAALVGESGANTLSLGQGQSSALQSAYESLQNASLDSTRPKSFLNYLFFDENMQLMPEHSRLWQADGEGIWSNIGTEAEDMEMPQNGYIAVYLSNESAGEVYYDNLTVTVQPGALLEEKHYYPYGLPIQGWGTAASGSLSNRQRYQSNEYREELSLNWMDFHNRQYDPQLGRFLSIDPLADAGGQQVLSPYHAMGCSPANIIDPFGLVGETPGSPGGAPTVSPAGIFPTLHMHLPGGSLFGSVTNYYRQSMGGDGYLNALLMKAILSGNATDGGAALFDSEGKIIAGGNSTILGSYLQDLAHFGNGGVSSLNGRGKKEQMYHATFWEMVLSGEFQGKLDIVFLKNGFIDVTDETGIPVTVASDQQQNGGSNVDPSTLGHNIFWSNYIGPWNPKDFNGDWNYDAAPKNAADRNAFIHDKGYDRFRAEGLGGVLLDRRVISIDERFISGQWQVMTGRGYSLTERFQAGVSGAFIDGATMPKRTGHIVKEIEYGFNGFINNLISSWMRGYR